MSEKTKTVRRIYSMLDTDMKSRAMTTHSLFAQDMVDFMEFDSTLNADFATAWGLQLKEGLALPTNELYRDQMQGKTAKVKICMKACRKKYNDVKYFVQRAFPTQAEVQHAFGLNNYSAKTKNYSSLHEFMLVLHTTAIKYKDKLTSSEVGYSQAEIDEIGTSAIALLDSITELGLFKNAQHTATQERIELLNAIYRKFALVASAAKIIYENNYAKYHQYLIYQDIPKEKKKTKTKNLTVMTQTELFS